MAHKNTKNHSPYKTHLQGKQQEKSRGHIKPEIIYSESEALKLLNTELEKYQFTHIKSEQRILLVKFYRLLMQEQMEQNFTRIVHFPDIVLKHFIDCMIVSNLYPLQFPLIDMGSGPGFPGIPLAILHPNETIILVEGVGKRCDFLRKVAQELGLKNIEVVQKNLNKNIQMNARGLITRAVEDISNSMRNALNAIDKGGQLYFMKGPNVGPELEAAKKMWRNYFQLDKELYYNLPKSKHERSLLVFTKTISTLSPKEYKEAKQNES